MTVTAMTDLLISERLSETTEAERIVCLAPINRPTHIIPETAEQPTVVLTPETTAIVSTVHLI